MKNIDKPKTKGKYQTLTEKNLLKIHARGIWKQTNGLFV